VRPEARAARCVLEDKAEHVERIATMRGRGKLIRPGTVFKRSVSYSINMYCRYSGTGPEHQFGEGSLLGISPGALKTVMELDPALELELQDGRRAKIILQSADGEFQLDGAIEYVAPKNSA
jgi:hypothetical protein